MRLGALLVLACACACGRLGFDPLAGPPVPGDGGPDGPAGDGSTTDASGSGTCIAPGNGSTFPGGTPCADWGASAINMGAQISETGSSLVITPLANTQGSQNGCLKTAVAFGTGGAIIEVTSVLAGANTLTAIQLGLGATALSIVESNGMLLAQDSTGTLGMVAYNAATMKWWRIRPAATKIVFEYGDGTTWTQLGASLQTPQQAYDFRIIAGEIFAEPNPGSAVYQSVNLCP